MNLVTLPDGRIINLDYLTHLERTGDYVILHLSSGGDGGSIIRVKQGEGGKEGFDVYRRPVRSED